MARTLRDVRLTRRSLLAGAAAGAGWLVAGGARAAPRIREAGFGCGVASGVPGGHGITVWTRVDGQERDGRLWLEVARDPGFSRVVHRREVDARAADDFTVHATLRGQYLKPGEEYHYRFHTRDSHSPPGRLRTLRPPDSREPVRIAFWSCQAWSAGYYAAHADMARDGDLDLVVGLGDYVYEATGDAGPRQDTIGPDQSAQTLDEYRAKYRLYRSDADLRAMHAAHPYMGVWDDHEVESSYYGMEGGNVQGRARRVPFPARRANGYRAFFEHMPFARFASRPDRIHRNLRLGAHAELFLLDLHQHADPLACRDQPTVGPTTVGPCAARHDRNRSLMGQPQRAWLLRELRRSRATWKVLGSSMMMMGLMAGPDQPFNLSQWDGWAGERAVLMEHLLANRIQDVLVVSGDIHTFFAGQVTTTGESDGRPAAVEVIGSSISSSGIPEGLARGADPATVATVTERVSVTNPHIRWSEQTRRGYAVLELARDEARIELRAVADAHRPSSPVSTLQRLRVARGVPDVELV
ncbi:MAG: alkaline phosphatase [Solirubrobacteraceae bacterium]|jgi:alkaline phosphatase D|nr:alkaline phosphatase [Solirubrobacteraceae bacterium]